MAQSVASVAMNAGSATDITGARANAVAIAPSFTTTSAQSSVTLGANAVRFGNAAWSAGVSAGGTARGAERRLTPVLDVGAAAATTSYDFSYATAEITPSMELRAGAARFFGGAHLGVAGVSAMTATGTTPPMFGPLPQKTQSAHSSSARSIVAGVNLSTVAPTGETATLGYRGEAGSVAGASQTDHSISGSIGSSRVMMAAMLARRSATEASTYGNASVAIAATPAVSVQIAAGKYPANTMLGTAAGKFVNAGLVLRMRGGSAASPAPTGVPRPDRGMTRLAIRAKDAARVEVAGDFNKWQLVSTKRTDNGVWYVDLAVPPGEYRYAFRIDGKEWRVPEGVAAADDGFGGRTAWLTVNRTDARSSSK